MKTPRAILLAAALSVSVLAACGKSAPTPTAPPPAEVSAQATGHYCGMRLADHDGPKGQIHLASRKDPVWFSSVRDAVSFLRLPEEARDVTAIYVNDMGKAARWEQPEPGTWVDARAAWFVIESDRRGGMGGPEAVPFSERAAAQAFVDRHGGRLARLDEIPDAYVLGPVNLAPHASEKDASGHSPPTRAQGPAPKPEPAASGHSHHSRH